MNENNTLINENSQKKKNLQINENLQKDLTKKRSFIDNNKIVIKASAKYI